MFRSNLKVGVQTGVFACGSIYTGNVAAGVVL